MAYIVTCNVCGEIGRRSYYGNAEKIKIRHNNKKKYHDHIVDVKFFNALIESLKKSETNYFQ